MVKELWPRKKEMHIHIHLPRVDLDEEKDKMKIVLNANDETVPCYVSLILSSSSHHRPCSAHIRLSVFDGEEEGKMADLFKPLENF